MILNNKTVVLLVNLGTPNQPTTKEVKNFLKEFLSDSDVVRLPRIFWLPILHMIILRFRPKKSAELYKKVWSEWGSPLLYNSFLQAGLLQKKLNNSYTKKYHVDVAMRYGKPSLESKLIQFQEKGFKKIILIPMFPQYSTTTTKSIGRRLNEIMESHKNLKNMFEIKFIKDFFADDSYIKAMAGTISRYQNIHGKPEKLILSFHGIPKSYIGEDEPYQEQCFKTADLIANYLELEKKSYEVVFQSRFGKAKWLQPYLAKRLEELPKENIKNIQVFCPGFVCDCLETLEEIAEESKELFLESGGGIFNFIPCLNGDEKFIETLENIIINADQRSLDYITLL